MKKMSFLKKHSKIIGKTEYKLITTQQYYLYIFILIIWQVGPYENGAGNLITGLVDYFLSQKIFLRHYNKHLIDRACSGNNLYLCGVPIGVWSHE
jgi:hypothetical protein